MVDHHSVTCYCWSFDLAHIRRYAQLLTSSATSITGWIPLFEKKSQVATSCPGVMNHNDLFSFIVCVLSSRMTQFYILYTFTNAYFC